MLTEKYASAVMLYGRMEGWPGRILDMSYCLSCKRLKTYVLDSHDAARKKVIGVGAVKSVQLKYM